MAGPPSVSSQSQASSSGSKPNYNQAEILGLTPEQTGEQRLAGDEDEGAPRSKSVILRTAALGAIVYTGVTICGGLMGTVGLVGVGGALGYELKDWWSQQSGRRLRDDDRDNAVEDQRRRSPV